MKKNSFTTTSGKPNTENENAGSMVPRGPLVLQDFTLHEKIQRFHPHAKALKAGMTQGN